MACITSPPDLSLTQMLGPIATPRVSEKTFGTSTTQGLTTLQVTGTHLHKDSGELKVQEPRTQALEPVHL